MKTFVLITRWLRTLAVVVLASSAAAGAEECPPVLLGTLGGSARGVEIAGDIAYVAVGQGGVIVVDVSDVTAPRVLSSLPLDNDAVDIALHGSMLCVANSGSGVEILDVSVPASPRRAGRYHTNADEVASVDDHTICVAGEGFALDFIELVDVSVANAPVQLSSVSTTNVRDLCVEGDRLYVARGGNGLDIYDIGDRTRLERLSRTNTGTVIDAIRVVDGVLYGVSSQGALTTVDVSDPTVPVLFATITGYPRDNESDDESAGIYLDGDFAYVASVSCGLSRANVSDPRAPWYLPRVYSDPAVGVAVVGDRAFLAAPDTGLKIVDASGDAGLLGALDLPNSSRGIAVQGDLVFVADGDRGVMALDVYDPGVLNVIGRTENWDPALRSFKIAAAGRYLFVSTGLGQALVVVDVIDPVEPKVRSTLGFPGSTGRMQVQNDTLYVACGGVGVCVVDVSDPLSPTIDSTYESDGPLTDLLLVEDVLYVAQGSLGVEILSIENPSAPEHIGVLSGSFGYACELASEAGALYVGSIGSGAGVHLYDAYDPRDPVLSSALELDDVPSLGASGDMLYVATLENRRLVLLSVAGKTTPEVRSEVSLQRSVYDIEVAGSKLYVAGDVEGVAVIAPEYCTPDIDASGSVGPGDLAQIILFWEDDWRRADLDHDGVVGPLDLAILLAAWGTSIDVLHLR